MTHTTRPFEILADVTAGPDGTYVYYYDCSQWGRTDLQYVLFGGNGGAGDPGCVLTVSLSLTGGVLPENIPANEWVDVSVAYLGAANITAAPGATVTGLVSDTAEITKAAKFLRVEIDADATTADTCNWLTQVNSGGVS